MEKQWKNSRREAKLLDKGTEDKDGVRYIVGIWPCNTNLGKFMFFDSKRKLIESCVRPCF